MSGKSRTISIRLSDGEYQEIKDKCGGISLSECVRTAITRGFASAGVLPDSTSPKPEIALINARLDQLDRKLEEIAKCTGVRFQ